VVRHVTAVADLWDEQAVKTVYYRELEALVRDVTGASRVVAFDHNLRSAARVAKTSEGNRSTGSRLMVARAAPVTMFVAPGPTEDVQASVESRLRILAKPTAACTIACSFLPW